MRNKFLKSVMKRSEKSFKESHDKITASILFISTELYLGGLKKTAILTAYCKSCYAVERYQRADIVDGILNCSRCNSDIKIGVNTVVYHRAQTGRFTAYKEQHSKGFISIENLPTLKAESDLGIQISADGRVWLCIDGISFLRFKPRGD